MIQINGNLLAEKVLKKARKEIQDEGLSPSLAIIFIGTDSGSAVYIKKKQEAGEKIGVRVVVYQFDSATTEEICTLTGKLALDSKVSGIILQLPAPGIDINKVFALIPPAKDVDGLNPLSLGKLWQGGYEQGQKYMIPATPAAIMFVLEQAASASGASLKQLIAGKEVLIIGRSVIIGKPLAALLVALDATVTIAHSKTADLSSYISRADIIISAAGVPGLITADAIKQGAIIIDAGFKKIDEKILGDIGVNDLSAKAAFVSPVPNGIGPLGVAFLITNTVTAADCQII